MEIVDGMHKTSVADGTPVMTHEEWLAEGKRRFGEDFDNWKFVCPICKNVASVGDFRKYKDKGATPDTTTQECIGRYDNTNRAAFPGGDPADKKGYQKGGPCDYALFGLFRFPGVVVTGSPHAVKDSKGVPKPMMAFAFAEVKEKPRTEKEQPHEKDGGEVRDEGAGDADARPAPGD